MTKGITEREPDPREVYGDIIDHPHWESPTHPPMSLYDRAAQFAPFAALSGYDDMIGEEARLVDNRIELSEEETEELNRKLSRMDEMIGQALELAAAPGVDGGEAHKDENDRHRDQRDQQHEQRALLPRKLQGEEDVDESRNDGDVEHVAEEHRDPGEPSS